MNAKDTLTPEAAESLKMKAGTVFQPRAPINTRELFAGRWDQLTTVADAVAQPGLHIVLFGERGVGKTSLANVVEALLLVMDGEKAKKAKKNDGDVRLVVKVNTHQGDVFGDLWKRAFDEVVWPQEKPVMGYRVVADKERITLRQKLGLSDSPTIDEVRRTLAILKGSVFVFDEFDRGAQPVRSAFTDLIKALSDYAIESTIILVGVSDTVDGLVRDHASIVRSIIQIQLPRMTENELHDIIKKASESLLVHFEEEAAQLIIRISQGLPHYTHLMGLNATREAASHLSSRIGVKDVHACFTKSVQQAVQSIRDKYMKAIHSAHKDALYDKVLMACAVATFDSTDALGYFHPSDVVGPLSKIMGRDTVTIATFQKHIGEFCEANRGCVLERSGVARAYKYRFSDPLLPPYIFMNAISSSSIEKENLRLLMTSGKR